MIFQTRSGTQNIPKNRKNILQKLSSLYIINSFTDGFPSGQRGQTVNLLAMPSKVRILLHPLLLQSIFALEFFCHMPKRFESFSIHYTLNSQVFSPGSFLSLFSVSATQRPDTKRSFFRLEYSAARRGLWAGGHCEDSRDFPYTRRRWSTV